MNKFLIGLSTFLVSLSCKTPTPTVEQKTVQTQFGENVKIYESSSFDLGPCEPSIYINPLNPDEIVAGSIINFAHRSKDGGKTWITDRLSSSLGVWGDPVIVADKRNNFYYFHLSDPEGTNWQSKKILDRIVVQRSGNAGKTFSSGTGIGLNSPKQQDKPWATVHPDSNQLYVTWTEFDAYGSSNPKDNSRILFSTSRDYGENWTNAIAINQKMGNALDGDLTTEGAVPAVAKDGTIYVAWAYDYKIWFDKSTDDGKSWLENDIVLAEQKAGWKFTVPGINRTNGMPVTMVDNSNGPHQGTIYVNWADQTNPDDTNVYISKSVDGGLSWSSPKNILNNDNGSHQFLTWMSVDEKTGFVYVLFYDRSLQEGNKTDVMLAVSKDGGASFTNTIISETSFDPTECSFFGDYINIHASNGIVRPIWTRYDSGKLSVWTALIEEK
ncbi:hypothetical protein GCM10009117_23520 [Gangjinia marincola]|uniref:Exo-alpha-sialidase n=1 Tax=Gangjinia marincola TaxID=578463 RepID=A0ABN1MJQ7_9FLAO